MAYTEQPKNIAGRPAPVAFHRGFQQLPTELLEEIYIFSENLSLSHVCRLFHTQLNTELTHMRFCTRIFFFGNPKNLASGLVALSLTEQANIILAQKWFTYDFAKKMERAVLQVQEEEILYAKEGDNEGDNSGAFVLRLCPYTGRRVYKTGPNEITTAKQVYLPARLLHGPWTEFTRNFVYLLQDWGVSLKAADVKIYKARITGTVSRADHPFLPILYKKGPRTRPKF